jgi:hypothetical protein
MDHLIWVVSVLSVIDCDLLSLFRSLVETKTALLGSVVHISESHQPGHLTEFLLNFIHRLCGGCGGAGARCILFCLVRLMIMFNPSARCLVSLCILTVSNSA